MDYSSILVVRNAKLRKNREKLSEAQKVNKSKVSPKISENRKVSSVNKFLEDNG